MTEVSKEDIFEMNLWSFSAPKDLEELVTPLNTERKRYFFMKGKLAQAQILKRSKVTPSDGIDVSTLIKRERKSAT